MGQSLSLETASQDSSTHTGESHVAAGIPVHRFCLLYNQGKFLLSISVTTMMGTIELTLGVSSHSWNCLTHTSAGVFYVCSKIQRKHIFCKISSVVTGGSGDRSKSGCLGQIKASGTLHTKTHCRLSIVRKCKERLFLCSTSALCFGPIPVLFI